MSTARGPTGVVAGPQDTADARRVASLDGLRGLAAAFVLVGHILLASSGVFAGAYAGHDPRSGSLWWVAVRTPLHVLWAGQAWVIVFFVLSGYVLSLPVAQGRVFLARAYYPSRLVRLYLPVWGALLVAALLRELVAHDAVGGATWWLNAHAVPVTARAVSGDAVLLFAGHFALAPALWSLKWEILFSLALPLFLVIGAAARRAPIPLIAVALVVVAAGPGSGVTYYLPPFVIGTAFAFGRGELAQIAGTLARARRRRAASAGLLTLAAVLLTAAWWLDPGAWLAAGAARDVLTHIAPAMVVAGAALMVACAVLVAGFERFLRSRAMQALGRRSFSLYLVHEPIVVALAFALGGRPSTLALAGLAVPAALLGAAAFHAAVERPSHRLSRRVRSELASPAPSHGEGLAARVAAASER